MKRKCAILRKKVETRTALEKSEVREFELIAGLSYKIDAEKRHYVIPDALRKSMVIRFHDLRSHPGVDRTLNAMRQHYHFPGMRRYIRRYVRDCTQCIIGKKKPGRQKEELHPIAPGNRPSATIHVDHSGSYVTSARQKRYVFAIIDKLPRLNTLQAVRDTKATGVIRALKEFVLQYGVPIRLISDRGTCFTTAKFKEFSKTHGVHHILTSPRHPQNPPGERNDRARECDSASRNHHECEEGRRAGLKHTAPKGPILS